MSTKKGNNPKNLKQTIMTNTITLLTDTEASIQCVERSISETERLIFTTENKIRLAGVFLRIVTNEDQRKIFTQKEITLNKELVKLKGQLSTYKYGYSELINKHLKQLN